MTPEEVDQLAVMCFDACMTETGKRLYSAIVTDGVFTQIVGDHPDPGAVADEMGNSRIIEVATRDERERAAARTSARPRGRR